ncbi:hypothetical protein QUF55_00760 [Clostridiaceae bacterium HSG29]|nr:hypothetical protein [Clostridiaceae bacterium HSG29]
MKKIKFSLIIIVTFIVIFMILGCAKEKQNEKEVNNIEIEKNQEIDETSNDIDEVEVEDNVVDNESDKIVYIKDSALEQLIRETINKETGDITISDMQEIYRININYEDYPVYELDGLEYASNLENFSYRYGKLKDINCIANNEKMNYFSMSYSTIEDTNIIDFKTPMLESVSFIESNVSDFNFLAGVSSINKLTIMRTSLNSIDFLENMNDLETVNLANNKIDNIFALENKKSLSELNLQGNLISDITPLASCNNLKILTLSYNVFEDIGPLFEIDNLAYVKLYEEIAAPKINKNEIKKLIDTGVSVEYHE